MVSPRLDRLLDEPLACDPEKLALACGERRVSYAELSDLERRVATALFDAGLAGERVAFLLPNSIELVACYLGCWRAGVTAVPFECVDAPPEIAYGLTDSAARWLIVHEEKLPDLAKVDLAHTRIERVLVAGPVDAHDPLDAQRWTALFSAAANGRVDVATLLLARGAARTGRDAGGASALGTACRARHAAVVELLLREDEVVPAIVADLGPDRPVTVRRHAAYDAGCTGDERVVPPIEAALRADADPEIAFAATHALEQLASPSTRPALELALRSRDPLVARTAAAALARLDPEAARAQARELVRSGDSAASVEVGRQVFAMLGDAACTARIDRGRAVAPLAVPLLLLGTLGATCMLSLRSPAASAARAVAAALDAAVAAGLTVALLVAAAVLLPAGRGLLGLPERPQPYAEGAALLAILIAVATTVTAAWVAALASFFDTPLPTRWVRALLKGLVAAALAGCVLPVLGGEGPLASPLGPLRVDGRISLLALTIGAAIALQTSISALGPFGTASSARAWALDRLGPLAFTGLALGLVLLLTTGASWAGALAAYAASEPFGMD